MELLGLFSGAALGCLAGYFWARARLGGAVAAAEHQKALSAQAAAEAAAIGALEQQRQTQLRCNEYQQRLEDRTRELGAAQTQIQAKMEQVVAERAHFEEIKAQTRVEFEALAQKVLEAKSNAFASQSQKDLEKIMLPMKERILAFEKSMGEKFHSEGQERATLGGKIDELVKQSSRVSNEANALTEALRGDSKVQGDWGEVILERILESSGLKAGMHYQVQATVMGEEGNVLRPDVTILLPEGKHVIVDSKVSLTDWDRYCRASNDAERSQFAKAHVKSIERHAEQLSAKAYAHAQGVNSPDFVFMFVPIEPAYLLAMSQNAELAPWAWSKHVAIVTSTTLFTSLKTVEILWRVDAQDKNAQTIVQESGRLYDKFVLFCEDLTKVGDALGSAQKYHEAAVSKLKDGRGNIFRKVELLRELGARTNKRLEIDPGEE